MRAIRGLLAISRCFSLEVWVPGDLNTAFLNLALRRCAAYISRGEQLPPFLAFVVSLTPQVA